MKKKPHPLAAVHGQPLHAAHVARLNASGAAHSKHVNDTRVEYPDDPSDVDASQFYDPRIDAASESPEDSAVSGRPADRPTGGTGGNHG